MDKPIVVNILPINGETTDGQYKTNRLTVQSIFSNPTIVNKIEKGWIQGGLTHKNRNVNLDEYDPTTIGIAPSEALIAYGKGTHFFKKIWINESAGYIRGWLVPLKTDTPESKTLLEYIDKGVIFGTSVVIKLKKDKQGFITVDDLLGVDVTIGPYFSGCTLVTPDNYDMKFIDGPEYSSKLPKTFSEVDREIESIDYIRLDTESFSARDYVRQIQKPLPEFLRWNIEDVRKVFNANSKKPEIQKSLLEYLSFMIDNLIISVGQKSGIKVDLVKTLQLNRYGSDVTNKARILNREYVKLLREKERGRPISPIIQNKFTQASKEFKKAFMNYFISKTNSKDFLKANQSSVPNTSNTVNRSSNVSTPTESTITASERSLKVSFTDPSTSIQIAEAGIQPKLTGIMTSDIFYTEYLFQLQLLIDALVDKDFTMRRIHSEPFVKISAEALKNNGEITIIVDLFNIPKYLVELEYKVFRNNDEFKSILTSCKYLGQLIYNGNSINSPIEAFHKLAMMGGAGFDMRNLCKSIKFCRIGLVGLLV